MSKQKNKSNRENATEKELTPWQIANQNYLRAHNQEETNQETSDPNNKSETEPSNPNDLTSDEKIEHQGIPLEENEELFVEPREPRDPLLYKRLAIILGVLAVPLVGLIYYVSPLSKLNAIEVSGNQQAQAQEIVQESELLPGDSIWSQYFHKNDYENNLKMNQPRIKTATISLQNMNDLKINVVEYKEVALVAKDNQYYPVLENGKVLKEKIANPTKNLPILEGFNDGEKIIELLKQYNQLNAEMQKRISEIKYTPSTQNKDLLQLNMNDGNQVIVNITNFAKQLQLYPKVAKDMQEKGVVDMEVGIFSYPASQAAEEAATDEASPSETHDPAASGQDPASASQEEGASESQTASSEQGAESANQSSEEGTASEESSAPESAVVENQQNP